MNPITSMKSAIIGRAWKNKEDASIIPSSITVPSNMTFGANETYIIGALTFKTDFALNSSLVEGTVAPVELKSGDKLFFYTSNKREGHDKDPDYTVSVKLAEETANAIINNSRVAREAYTSSVPH